MDRFTKQTKALGMDGEDLAQQAFFKAIKELPNFKGDSSFFTWLYKIGKNEALNAVTSAGREVPTESMFKAGEAGGGKPGSLTGNVGFGGEDVGNDPIKPSVQGAGAVEDTPEALNAGHQIAQLVQQTIKTLPKHYAEVVEAAPECLDGLTDVETARVLKREVATVRQQAIRGQQVLAQALKGTDTEALFKKAGSLNKQGGSIDPELLKRLAKFAIVAGGGAALGVNYFDPQHPYKLQYTGYESWA